MSTKVNLVAAKAQGSQAVPQTGQPNADAQSVNAPDALATRRADANGVIQSQGAQANGKIAKVLPKDKKDLSEDSVDSVVADKVLGYGAHDVQSVVSAESESSHSATADSHIVTAAEESGDDLLSAEDKATLAKLEQAANQADGLTGYLESAAQNIGLMFAQSSGSAAAGAATSFGTGSLLAGVVVIGAAAAAAGSDSSSSGAGGVSLSGSLSTLARTVTFSTVTPSFSSASVLENADGLYLSTYTGSASNQLIRLFFNPAVLAAQGGLSDALALSDADGNLADGVLIDGGAGTDAVRLAMAAGGVTTAALYLENVEVFEAQNNFAAAASIDTTNFDGVRELWNWESTLGGVTFGNVASTGTVIGMYNTGTATTATYTAAASASSRVVTVVADTTLAGSAITLNSAAIDVNAALTTINLSSNGSAGTTNVLDGITGASSIETLNIYGDRALTLSNLSLTGLDKIDASGLSQNFTWNAGLLTATNPEVMGGSGTGDKVTGTVATDVALSLSRVEQGQFTFAADKTVNLTSTTGMTTVALAVDPTATDSDPSFSGVQAGTKFTTAGGFAATGTSTFAYRALSDFDLTVTGASNTFGGITLTGVEDATITSQSTTAGVVGAVTIGASDAKANSITLADSGAGTFVAGAVSSAQAKALTVNLSTSAAGNMTVASLASSKDALTASLSSASANVNVTGAVSAEKDLAVTLTAAVGSTAGIGGLSSSGTGDVTATLTAQASPGGATTIATASMGDIAATSGEVSLVANSLGGSKATDTTATGSSVVVGKIDAAGDISLKLGTQAGGKIDVSTAGNIDSTAGSVLIDINNVSSAGRRSQVDVADGQSIFAEKQIVVDVDNGRNGSVTIGALTSDSSTVAVAAALASDSSVTIGAVTAQKADVGAFTLGTSKAPITLGDNSTFTMGGLVTTNQSIAVTNVQLATNATLNLTGGLTSEAGSVVVAPVAGTVGSAVNIGIVTAAADFIGRIDVGARATKGDAITIDKVTAGGAIDLTLSAGTSSEIELGLPAPTNLQASGNVKLDITTGIGTANNVTTLISDRGSVSVKAVVNSELVAANNTTLTFTGLTAGALAGVGGSVTLDAKSVVHNGGKLDLGTISAQGASGGVVIKDITVLDDATLEVTAITANRNIDITANLSSGATLGASGDIKSTSGNVLIRSTSNAVGVDIDFDGNIKADAGTLTIDVASGSDGLVQLASGASTLTSGGLMDLDVAVGPNGNTNEVGAGGILTTDQGANISISAQVATDAALATKLTFGAVTSTQGNVTVESDTSVGRLGALEVGAINALGTNANGGQGATVMVGASAANAVALDAGATLKIASIRASDDVGIYVAQTGGNKAAADSTDLIVTSTIQSDNGKIDIFAGSAANASAQNNIHLQVGGAITAEQALNIRFIGGADSTVNLAALNSDAVISVTGALGADTASLGKDGGFQTGAISGDAGVTLNLALGSGTTSSTGAVESTDGDVDFLFTVGDLLADPNGANDATLTLGAVTSPEGSVRVSQLSSIGAESTLTIGGIDAAASATTGGSISIGNRNGDINSTRANVTFDRINLGVDSTFVTGKLEAVQDIGLYAFTRNGAEIATNLDQKTAEDITSYLGGVHVVVRAADENNGQSLLGSTESTLRLAHGDVTDPTKAGDISAKTFVEVGFIGGQDSEVAIGNVRVLEAGTTQFKGINLALSVGNTTGTTNKDRITVGSLESNGDKTNTALGLGEVNIVASAGTGSVLEIATNPADRDIEANGNINLDITVGRGLDAANTITHLVAASGANTDHFIRSESGDVNIKAVVVATMGNDKSVQSDLRFGDIIANDGAIIINGDTEVRTQGHLKFGQMEAGVSGSSLEQRIAFGSSTNSIEIQTGGDKATNRTTELTTQDLLAEGNIEGYFTLGDGARIQLGEGATRDIGGANTDIISSTGSVTFDIRSRGFLTGGDVYDATTRTMAAAYTKNGEIKILDIQAAATATLTLISTEDTIDSPWIDIGDITASTINVTYTGNYGGTSVNPASPNFIQNSNVGTFTAGTFNGTFAGSVNVTLTDADLVVSALNVQAANLTGVLNTTDTTFTAATVVGGSNNDVINLQNASSSVLVQANGGNDTVTVTSLTASINLGEGVNTLTSTVGLYMSVAGGSSTDTVTVNGAAPTVIFNMGEGTNTVTMAGGATASSSFTYTGGGGSDTVTHLGTTNATNISLGNGNNTLTAATLTFATVTAGNGTDSITIAGGNTVSVDGGEGQNTSTVTATNATVTGGGGVDTVTLTTTNAVVNVGSSNNSVTVTATGTTNVTAGSGNDGVTVTGGTNTTVAVDAGVNTVQVGSSSGTVVVTASGTDTVNIGATSAALVARVTTSGGSGADSVTVKATTVEIIAGSTNDTFSVSGATSSTVDGGGGNDTFTVASTNSTLTGTAGNDTFTVTGGTNANVAAGDGTNSVNVASTNSTITAGTGSDSVTVTNGTSATVSVSDGTNTVNVTSVNATVTSGAGTDSITISNATRADVNAGDGANTVSVAASGQSTVTGGSGNDNITITGNGAHNVAAGGGTNSITLTTTAASTITLSGASDNLAAGGSAGNLTVNVSSTLATVTSGGGVDVITLSGNGTRTIDSGGGVDTITTSGTTTVDGGAGDDLITLGTGADDVQLGNVTADGIDTVTGFTSGTDDFKFAAVNHYFALGSFDSYGAGGANATLNDALVDVAAEIALQVVNGNPLGTSGGTAAQFQYGNSFYVFIDGSGNGYSAASDAVVKLSSAVTLTTGDFIA